MKPVQGRPAAKAARFDAVLLAGHKGCAVEVPFDPAVRWGIAPGPLWRGRRGHRVEATLNGLLFVDAVVPRSGRFWLLASDELLASARVAAGDRVEITIAPVREHDAAPARPARRPRQKGPGRRR